MIEKDKTKQIKVLLSNTNTVQAGWAQAWNLSLPSYQRVLPGTSLAVQWLRLHASTAEGEGSIPGWGTKIPHAAQCSQNKQTKYLIIT